MNFLHHLWLSITMLVLSHVVYFLLSCFDLHLSYLRLSLVFGSVIFENVDSLENQLKLCILTAPEPLCQWSHLTLILEKPSLWVFSLVSLRYLSEKDWFLPKVYNHDLLVIKPVEISRKVEERKVHHQLLTYNKHLFFRHGIPHPRRVNSISLEPFLFCKGTTYIL